MLKIADTIFQSRLFLGSGKFANSSLMIQAIQASGSQLVTMAMKRIDLINKNDDILLPLQKIGVKLLPNTSGAKNAQEALFAARLARDALATNWIKLEIHPDTKYLLPDPIETLKAAELLVKEGFIVLPYCSADPVLCRHLEEVGCAAVMPLGAPIGSNKGLITYDFLQIIIEQASIPVVVDAGLGAPSHALAALEIGADAVLVNTAIAVANDPVAMAHAFRIAIEAGDIVQTAGLAAQQQQAAPSSSLTQFLEAFQ
ncbi:MAG TPA: thiazole synthase [Arsenophonus apicola]|uniref:thiazole synthase n=1 Tax=Arsenophonus apicola TaxID=2879119 RepID=UPI001CDB77E3|nr:thiazole synthase [Arsenophonus apicola]UBX28987.1 thiazole synthase [Arsenophonus apicola]